MLDSLAESQATMAEFANRHRRDVSLDIGSRVWLSTKYLPLKTASRKLSALWAGPYRVLERVGNVAYKLELPSTWNIHNVFHVSQLKSVVGNVVVEESIDVDGSDEYEIERIL